MEETGELEQLIWDRFRPDDAPADTALGLAQRFGVDEEAALAVLTALVADGKLESLVVGRLTVFCRVGKRPLLLDRWYVSEPSLWRRSSSTQTPRRATDQGAAPDTQAALDK